MDSFMNSFAAGLGYLVIFCCVIRVLLPLAGRWVLRAFEMGYLECVQSSARIDQIKQLEKMPQFIEGRSNNA